jgi:hypothetical protein
MLEKTRVNMGDAKFFSYDALRGNNCQNFVAELLKAMNLYGAAEKDFVFQDIKSLVEELPQHLLTFQKATTNLGALFNKATGIGGGMRNKEYDFKLDDLAHRIEKIEKMYGSGWFSDLISGQKNFKGNGRKVAEGPPPEGIHVNEKGQIVDKYGKVYHMSERSPEERFEEDVIDPIRNFYGFGKFRSEMNMRGYGGLDLAPIPYGRPPPRYGNLVDLERQKGR